MQTYSRQVECMTNKILLTQAKEQGTKVTLAQAPNQVVLQEKINYFHHLFGQPGWIHEENACQCKLSTEIKIQDFISVFYL